MWRAVLGALVVTVAVLAVAGCGESDQDRIARLLTNGLTSTDPRIVCEGSLSPALLTRIYGGAAKCRATESEPAERISQAQSVEVRGVRVRGRRATAIVVIHGGNHDGARGELSLYHRLGGWRVVDLSVALLRSQFEASIRRMQSIDGSTRSCVTRRMRAFPDAAFRTLAYGSDELSRTQLSAVAQRCQALLDAAARMTA
jgi:hypothetical protein